MLLNIYPNFKFRFYFLPTDGDAHRGRPGPEGRGPGGGTRGPPSQAKEEVQVGLPRQQSRHARQRGGPGRSLARFHR